MKHSCKVFLSLKVDYIKLCTPESQLSVRYLTIMFLISLSWLEINISAIIILLLWNMITLVAGKHDRDKHDPGKHDRDFNPFYRK